MADFVTVFSNDIMQSCNRFKKCSQSLSSKDLTFGDKCSKNAVKQNLHECEFFIAVERGSRHNFWIFLDPPLNIWNGVLALDRPT